MSQLLKLFTIILSLVNVYNVGECHPASKVQAEENDVSNSIKLPKSYYLSNQIPSELLKNCKILYECQKELGKVEQPKPCFKYCIKEMECQDGIKTPGQPDQCLVLNEQLVAKEYDESKEDNEDPTNSLGAMIDFPCQPDYLPDSHGRCREIW